MIFQEGGGGSDIRLNDDLLSVGRCLIFFTWELPNVAKLVFFFSPECQGAG